MTTRAGPPPHGTALADPGVLSPNPPAPSDCPAPSAVSPDCPAPSDCPAPADSAASPEPPAPSDCPALAACPSLGSAVPGGREGFAALPATVAAVSVGEAVLEAVAGRFVGCVSGVFADGFYVTGPSRALFAVLGPRHWPGPLHLVVEELSVRPSLHDQVRVSGGVLAAGPLRVRLDGAPCWAPSLPERLAVGPAAWLGLATEVGSAGRDGVGTDVGRSAWPGGAGAGAGRAVRPSVAGCVDAALVPIWRAVSDDLRRGDLSAACRRLEGRGAGLTPSGDDVLAGILLVSSIDLRRRPALTELAWSARTTRLSRAFLRWAAAGHSIQPAHSLLDAAAVGDHAGMRRAARSLASLGATSGQALVAGIALAAAELPSATAPRPAAARRSVEPTSPRPASACRSVEPRSLVGLSPGPALSVAKTAATTVPRPAVA